MNVTTHSPLIKKSYSVNVYDLDMNASPSMLQVCNYMQDIGINHAIQISKDAGINMSEIVFVLTRLHVRMESFPAWNETIKIESWLSPIKDKYVIRNFEVYGQSGNLIGRGINSAVSFSMKERKGVTLDIDSNIVNTLEREPALPHNFERLPQIEAADRESSITVRYFDCDLYRHVNNVKYIQWCAETLPFDFLKKNRLHEIDINFRSEGNFGDTLISRAVRGEEDGVFYHAITDSTGGRELVRMRSTWKAK